MLLRGNLYPIARGDASKKSGKKQVVFICSYFGKKDKDGLFTETSVVDCWLPPESADVLKASTMVEGVINISGDFIMLREFTFNGKTYVVNDKGQAELKDSNDIPF